MHSHEMTREQFEETISRLGFQRVGLEAFFTVLWKPDGRPGMGVSVKSCGSSYVAQLAFLVKARNRLIADGLAVAEEDRVVETKRVVRSVQRREERVGGSWTRDLFIALIVGVGVLLLWVVFGVGVYLGREGFFDSY